MKSKRFFLSILCVLSVFISTVNVYATDAVVQGISIIENNAVSENKIICTATLNDEFEEDSIIVVLKKDANSDFRTLTQADFPKMQEKM